MYTWLQEVTDWDTPNHTYILNEQNHCVGYVKRNTTDVIMFNNPLKQFSKSRRKFKKVKAYVGN